MPYVDDQDDDEDNDRHDPEAPGPEDADPDANADWDTATTDCPYCKKTIAEESEWCPHCGKYISSEDAPPTGKPFWILVGFILAALGALLWMTI